MIAILIVGYRDPDSIADCLRALARLRGSTSFEIYIAENGGAAAAEALIATLSAAAGPCRCSADAALSVTARGASRQTRLDLLRPGADAIRVHVAELAENTGYAGGVNAWLRSLLEVGGWNAAWILNPDTAPAPDALEELAAYAVATGKGMIASRLVPDAASPHIWLRGLAWSRLRGNATGVDWNVAQSQVSRAAEVEARLESPSGASIFVQRSLIETIGLMEDSYFLYYEDLDWGFRAKAIGELGYADRSIVAHAGGSTISGSGAIDARSSLAVYLEFRNRILFVRRNLPRWTAWTVVMQVAHVIRYLFVGGFRNTYVASQGVLAGLRGERGRPERLVREHQA